MSAATYIAKEIEVSTDMDEFEWEDSVELAREVLSLRPEGADYCFISAGNVDWRGNSGCGIFDIRLETYKVFWQKIAGWDNADWTLRIKFIGSKPRKFDAVAYSHDTPTGGGRVVRFLTGRGVVEKLLLDGTSERKSEVYEHFGVSSKPELVRALQNGYMADEVRELL